MNGIEINKTFAKRLSYKSFTHILMVLFTLLSFSWRKWLVSLGDGAVSQFTYVLYLGE